MLFNFVTCSFFGDLNSVYFLDGLLMKMTRSPVYASASCVGDKSNNLCKSGCIILILLYSNIYFESKQADVACFVTFWDSDIYLGEDSGRAKENILNEES